MIATPSREFTVPDMDCQGCVASITQAVKKLDNTASIAADLATKHVVVGSTAEAQAVAQAIEGAGFTVQAA